MLKKLMIKLNILQFSMLLIFFIIKDISVEKNIYTEPIIWIFRLSLLFLFFFSIYIEYIEKRSLLFQVLSIILRVLLSILLVFYSNDFLYVVPLLFLDVFIQFESKVFYIFIMAIIYTIGTLENNSYVLNSELYRAIKYNTISLEIVISKFSITKLAIVKNIFLFIMSTVFVFTFDILKVFFKVKREVIDKKNMIIEKLKDENHILQKQLAKISSTIEEAINESLLETEKIEDFVFSKSINTFGNKINVLEVYVHRYNYEYDIVQCEGRRVITKLSDNNLLYKKRLSGTIEIENSAFEEYKTLIRKNENKHITIVNREAIKELTGEEYGVLLIMYMKIDDEISYFITIGFEQERLDFNGDVKVARDSLFAIVKKKLETERKIQRLKEKNSEYYKMAYTDALTGMYNRTMFEKYAEEDFIQGEKTVGIIVFDIDKFKTINDTYGHDIGDMVIKQFSMVIQKNIKEYDLAIRNGGDEFVIIVESDNLANCEKAAFSIADRIRQQMEKLKFKTKAEIEFKTTVSGGVYCASNNLEDFKKFYKKADETLYESKREGRNKISIYNRKG
jgi:diguanylate cyclase (GGDEF)-like protein